MSVPIRGVFLNGKYFGYVPGSYKLSDPAKNATAITQSSKTFTALGLGLDVHTLTLTVDSYTTVASGVSFGVDLGTTYWNGISRIADLKSMISNMVGSSAIVFVSPLGLTSYVVPTGTLDIEIFNPDNPISVNQSTGEAYMDFRVSLTLESLS